MGIFDFFKPVKKVATTIPKTANTFNQAMFRFPFMGIPITTPYDLQRFADIYDTNAIIYALIDWKASRAAEIKPVLYEIKDSSKAKEFRKWNGKYIDEYEIKQLLKIKSVAYNEIDLDSVNNNDLTYGKLKQIFKRPSDLYSWKQYVYMYMASRDVSGFSVTWGNRLETGLSAGKVQGLYPLPSHLTEIIGGTQFDPIQGYKVINAAYEKQFDAKDCMLLRNHSFHYGSQGEFLYGTPRIKAALTEIDTYKASKDRELYGFQTGDTATILFPKDSEQAEKIENLSPDDRQNWADEIRKKVKQKDRNNLAVNPYALDSINISSPLSESRTNEAQKSILETLCGVWHIAPQLMGSQASSTFNNMKEVGKISLRDAVFPEMRELFEGLNDFLIPAYGKNLELQGDYDVFEEFSEDILVQAQALEKMPFFSDNEKRQWVDYSPIDDERANLPQAYWDLGFVENDGSYTENDPTAEN